MNKNVLRNTLVLAACAAILLTATACSSTNNNNDTGDNAGNVEQNSYIGTAEGYGGAVSVTVTVADGVITAVTAEGNNETPEIGGNAISAYNEDGFAPIIGTNITTADVDTIDAVTGATFTSEAVKEALGAALEQVQ